jgi:Bacterial Ig domain
MGVLWQLMTALSAQAVPPTARYQRVSAVTTANIYSAPVSLFFNPFDPRPLPIAQATTAHVGTTGLSQTVDNRLWFNVFWDTLTTGWCLASDLTVVLLPPLSAPYLISPGSESQALATIVSTSSPMLRWQSVSNAVAYVIRIQGLIDGVWTTLRDVDITDRWALSYPFPASLMVADRTYSWSMWTKNSDGVLSTTPSVFYFRASPMLDLLAPVVAVVSPISGTTVAIPQLTINGTVTDNFDPSPTVYSSLNDGPWLIAGFSSPWTATVTLLEGENSFRTYAIDTAGNLSQTVTTIITYLPDYLLPTISFSLPSDLTVTAATQLQVSGTASDNGVISLVQLRLDAGAWVTVNGTTTWSYTLSLPAGRHTLAARAIDSAGNESLIPTLTVSRRTALPVMAGTGRAGVAGVLIQFTGTPGMRYVVQRKVGIQPWASTGVEITAVAGVNSISLANELARGSGLLRVIEK